MIERAHNQNQVTTMISNIKAIAIGMVVFVLCATSHAQEVSRQQIEGLDAEKISISMGVATCHENNVRSFEELVKLSDDAMYESKAKGKGQLSQAN